VDGPEHKVTGLRERQCHADGLQVTQLADQQDIGVLAKGTAQGLGERWGVLPHRALVDHRPAVSVHVFDGVLDGDHMLGLVGRDPRDHRRQRGRLARAGRAGHEDETLGGLREPTDGFRQPQLVERRDLLRHQAHGHGQGVALPEEVATDTRSTSPAEGEVQITLSTAAEVELLGRQDLGEEMIDLIREQPGRAGQVLELPFDTDLRHHATGDVQVAATGSPQRLDELIHRRGGRRCRHGRECSQAGGSGAHHERVTGVCDVVAVGNPVVRRC
jgi:hypothetical protein